MNVVWVVGIVFFAAVGIVGSVAIFRSLWAMSNDEIYNSGIEAFRTRKLECRAAAISYSLAFACLCSGAIALLLPAVKS